MNPESARLLNVPQRAQSVKEALLARRQMLFYSVSVLFAATTIGCSESEVIVPVMEPGRKTKMQREREEAEKIEARSRKKSRSRR